MRIQHVTFTNNRRYGVEVEIVDTGLSRNFLKEVIRKVDKNHDVHVSGWWPSAGNTFWHVKTDSTCGLEIASYVACGYKDLMSIVKVVEAIRVAGAKVNDTCGLHIHVDIKDFLNTNAATLVAYWLKIENVISNLVPEHRVNNKYCRLLSKQFPKDDLSHDKDIFWQQIRPHYYGDYERRVAMNICPYVKSISKGSDLKKATVELRLPEGTLNVVDVKSWIRMFVNFVNYIKDKSFPSDYEKVDLIETLQILGLHAENDCAYIISDGLRETKDWFLKRILMYTRQKRLCKQAIDLLNFMWQPIKSFELSSNGEEYLEIIA